MEGDRGRGKKLRRNQRVALRWRLAQRLGIADPRELDELDEETWNHWHALSLVDDWGTDPFAVLAANIHNSLLVAVAKLHGSVDKDDFKTAEDFQRRFKWERKSTRKPVIQDGATQFAIFKNGCGV